MNHQESKIIGKRSLQTNRHQVGFESSLIMYMPVFGGSFWRSFFSEVILVLQNIVVCFSLKYPGRCISWHHEKFLDQSGYCFSLKLVGGY